MTKRPPLSQKMNWLSIAQPIWVALRHFWQSITRTPKPEISIQSHNYFEQQNGIVTLTYPKEKLKIPDNGRYQLHNEIDDCIVCDKCAEICPVNCIDIESIRAVALVGTASDGTPIRLYASKFDIDMSQCCYCGLCTTVCPTECLTMSAEYDISTFGLGEHILHFSNMSAQDAALRRNEWAAHQASKARPKD